MIDENYFILLFRMAIWPPDLKDFKAVAIIENIWVALTCSKGSPQATA